jgi:hypothetical protein
MNITVTHTVHPEVLALLQSFLTSSGGHTAAPVEKSTAKKNGKVLAAVVPEADEVEAPPVKTSAITVEQVRGEAQKVAKAGKREEVKKLIATYGADSISTLAQEHYADFLEKLPTI